MLAYIYIYKENTVNECFKSEIDILLLELNKILYASYSHEVKWELQINNESNKFLNKNDSGRQVQTVSQLLHLSTAVHNLCETLRVKKST